jgi:hypothetical protein
MNFVLNKIDAQAAVDIAALEPGSTIFVDSEGGSVASCYTIAHVIVTAGHKLVFTGQCSSCAMWLLTLPVEVSVGTTAFGKVHKPTNLSAEKQLRQLNAVWDSLTAHSMLSDGDLLDAPALVQVRSNVYLGELLSTYS